MFLKIGQSFEISTTNILSSEAVLTDPEIEANFRKFAVELKRIAPKADDFLYFSAVMMHAAEHALVNADGTTKLLANGKKAEAHWEDRGDSIRWVSNDPSIRPFKNNNLDIFPERELLKAYKKWIGKPLCIDHKSNSVDYIRGIIVDTYYDHIGKRVIALCALDKKNYPDLAHKVKSGYATSVSMGTAVLRAVCSDCGQVARTEQDFCNHMRSKSCYGEINLDLQPIELSIVVNGADPKAKIKHIIAAANSLSRYAEMKQGELASEMSDLAIDKVNEIKEKIVDDIKNGLNDLVREFESIKQDTTGSEAEAMSKEVTEEPISEKFDEEDKKIDNLVEASDNNEVLIRKFNEIKDSIYNTLSIIQQEFSKLSNLKDGLRETNMNKKGYFQGAGSEGGGVNMPTPGQTKYPAEPQNNALRERGDKHMEGQMDTGPVDGMHPGPESVGMSEMERKKMLARAEADERAARRKLAVEQAKVAYFQSGDSKNDPTPGKAQYPKEDADSIRDKMDRQMNGQAPFPGVGKVDGLHPSPESAAQKDELKRKEMLGRASLTAKFVKAATPTGAQDRANSVWQVFSNNKLVLTASVKDLSGGRVDTLYDVIATKAFGTKMLQKVKSVGLEKAASLYKAAQEMPAMPAMPEMPAAAPAALAAPAEAPAPAPAPAPSAAPETDDADEANKGGSGNPKETILTLVDKATNLLSDVKEEISNLKDEQVDMGPEMDDALPKATASLFKMRRELNAQLYTELRKCGRDLSDSIEELKLISSLYDQNGVTDTNREYVEAISEDAVNEANKIMAEAAELGSAYNKYSLGTDSMLKRAAIEKVLVTEAQDMNMSNMDMGDDSPSASADEFNDKEILAELGLLPEDHEEEDHEEEDHEEEAHGHEMHGDEMHGDSNPAIDVTMDEKDLAKMQTAGVKLQSKASFDLTTKKGRSAYRAKLAGDMKYSPMLDQAHKGGGTTPKFDMKPQGDLALVETLEENQERMLEVATAPAKVRKEAADILALVKSGKLKAEEVDGLVAHGVDADAVKYFKKMWADAEGGSEFASELVKEHVKAAVAEEMSVYRTKIARAYELAYDMVERGICARDREVVTAQVNEIMQYNDEAFDSLKRVVARHVPTQFTKEASLSRLPVVGQLGNGDPFADAAPQGDDFVSSLNRAFANRRY